MLELWHGSYDVAGEILAENFVGHWPDREVDGREALVRRDGLRDRRRERDLALPPALTATRSCSSSCPGGRSSGRRRGTRRLEPGAVLAFPRGPDGAHRIANLGDDPARVLVVSMMNLPEIAMHVTTGTMLTMTELGAGQAWPADGDQPLMELDAAADRRPDRRLSFRGCSDFPHPL